MSTRCDQGSPHSSPREGEAPPEELEYSLQDLPGNLTSLMYDVIYYKHKSHEAEMLEDSVSYLEYEERCKKAEHLFVKALVERGLKPR